MPNNAASPKVLLIVAHPDDEYVFAATVYRISKELSGTVDQVVITDGAGGHRYSRLAERFYSARFDGKAHLPEIRRNETLAAGRVLGIRHHHFLNQRDGGYTLDPGEGFTQWNTEEVTRWIADLMERERYDFVFALLPTPDTHGHHQVAAVIALDAISLVPPQKRPIALAADPARKAEPVRPYIGLPGHDRTKPWPEAPVFRFDRQALFDFHEELTYQIVVNWVIAEHKSQGLFQLECNRYDEERFWLLGGNSADALDRTWGLFESLRPPHAPIAFPVDHWNTTKEAVIN